MAHERRRTGTTLGEAEIEAILERDSLVRNAHEYAEVARGLVSGLDPLFKRPADAEIASALDTIDRLSGAIGRAASRACRHQLSDERSTDARGAATLVRALIRDSREGWRVLMQPGRAVGDGVPARMVARLDDLDREVVRRFQ